MRADRILATICFFFSEGEKKTDKTTDIMMLLTVMRQKSQHQCSLADLQHLSYSKLVQQNRLPAHISKAEGSPQVTLYHGPSGNMHLLL